MMQKFWLSECDTDLLYGSDVCRFRKADRQRRVKCELPNNPVLVSDGSELPGVCGGKRLWVSAKEIWPHSLCCVQCPCVSPSPLFQCLSVMGTGDRPANPLILPQIPGGNVSAHNKKPVSWSPTPLCDGVSADGHL